jgi:glutamate--cysteine ligase
MRALDAAPVDTTPAEAHPRLSEAAAEAWIPHTCFKNGPPGRIGVELELLVVDARHPGGSAAHFPRHRYPALLRDLADGGLDGRLTVEPGGQVELSSRPGPTLVHTVDAVHRDLSALHYRAARCGAGLVGIGADPVRPPRRIADHPRYVAMEQYLDAWGPAARTMMCATASVQINVEAGVLNPAACHSGGTRSAPPPPRDVAARWELLRAVGPALVAAFANSSMWACRPTGWKSFRQAAWMDLDPSRTDWPTGHPGEDLAATWTRCALDAPLMLVRRENGRWIAPRGVTFRDWLRHGRTAVPDRHPPTTDDLAYHLTTLFPPVRPRGHLEIRFIDAQPGDWWTVPTAVVAALLADHAAWQEARDACGPIQDRWRDAARVGLGDAELFKAANRVLQAAATALGRDPATTSLAGQVQQYLERWTARGRCPADDPPDGSLGGPQISRIDDDAREQSS